MENKRDRNVSSENYIRLATRTESNPGNIEKRLLHCGMGLCTEAGEIVDVMKRHIFYGSEIDKPNLVEELGDILWYVAVGCDALDVSMEDVMTKNIEKLQKRYPEKFTKDAAENRDLKSERAVFEEEK